MRISVDQRDASRMVARDPSNPFRTEDSGGSLRRRFPAWVLPSLSVALGINAILFLLLPMLTNIRVPAVVAGDPVAVTLVRLPEPEPPREEEKEPPEPTQAMRKPVASDTFQPELLSPRLAEMEMPALNLRMEPRLVGAPSDIGLNVFFNAEDLDEPPQVLAKIPPLYPYRAKRMEIEGFVKVKFLVDEKGAVSRMTVLEAEPEGMFEESVMKILPSWKFSPGRVLGDPVSSWVVTTIRFELG
jgi:periplasmic protein TonB